jgi:hypothetical protein
MWGQPPPAVRGAQLRRAPASLPSFPCKLSASPAFLPESGVSRAGSVTCTKVHLCAPPGIFSATIFYNGGCAEIVF